MPALPLMPRWSVRSYGAAQAAHRHGHAQGVLPLDGCLRMALGEGVAHPAALVHADQGVLVPAGLWHGFSARGPNRFVVLDFEAAGPGGSFSLDGGLRHLLAYLHELAARPSGHAELDHHAAALLAAAVRARTAPAPGRSPSAMLVQAALAHMRTGLGRPLRIAALAQALGCSPRTLQLAFRSETGRTPADHLAELRLDQATALLLEGRLPLAEVALACGYSEQSALTRAMRRRRGQTPGALRRVPAG